MVRQPGIHTHTHTQSFEKEKRKAVNSVSVFGLVPETSEPTRLPLSQSGMQSCQLYMATTKHLNCHFLQGMVALPQAPVRQVGQWWSWELAVVLFKTFLTVLDKACREHEGVPSISALPGGLVANLGPACPPCSTPGQAGLL